MTLWARTASLRFILAVCALVVAATMSVGPAAALENECPVESFIRVCLGESADAAGAEQEPSLPSGWRRERNLAVSDVVATRFWLGPVNGDPKVHNCSFASGLHSINSAGSRASYCTKREVALLAKWLAENRAKRIRTFDDRVPLRKGGSGLEGWVLEQADEADGYGRSGPFPADWLRDRRSGVWTLSRGRSVWTVTFVFHPPGETGVVSAATHLRVEKRPRDPAAEERLR